MITLKSKEFSWKQTPAVPEISSRFAVLGQEAMPIPK